MKTVGIICEYNPFHNGHARQFRLAREAAGEDCALVCLMSGNYVQRGEPAVFPKALRAGGALSLDVQGEAGALPQVGFFDAVGENFMMAGV